MTISADSSFLVSCYILDANSEPANGFFREHAGDIVVSPLTVLEFTNAIRARVFRSGTTGPDADLALRMFDSDVRSRFLRKTAIPPKTWDLARELSLKHTSTLGTRSLDILHVAVALGLGAGTFFTFDRTQARLARAEGLSTPIEI